MISSFFSKLTIRLGGLTSFLESCLLMERYPNSVSNPFAKEGRSFDRNNELSDLLKIQDNVAYHTTIERGNYTMTILSGDDGKERGRSCLVSNTTKAAKTTTTTKAKESAGSNKSATEVYKEETYGLKSDNLQLVEGIGPKINQLLNADGIVTWKQLGNAKVDRLEKVLADAGPRFKMHNPSTWPQQSALAAEGEWEALITLQKELDGGKAGSNGPSDSKLEKLLIKKGKRN